MKLQGASGAAMCRAFSLTLTGAAGRWYRKLRPGSISSFAQLSQIFINQFAGDRDHQLPSTHLLSVKQRKYESLKDYITRFNKEAVRVENYTDIVALTAIMAGLQPGKFHYSLAKNPPRTFTELLSRAQKYSNADELTNVKRWADSDSQRVGDKRNKLRTKKKWVGHKTKVQEFHRGRFWGYTPLVLPREQVLMQIRNQDLLRKPKYIKAAPNRRDMSKYTIEIMATT